MEEREEVLDELRIRVDEVLYYMWDPIGIHKEASTRGEYSSYVTPILNLVINGNEKAIEEKLTEIETEYISLPKNIKKNKFIAKYLMDCGYSLDLGWR